MLQMTAQLDCGHTSQIYVQVKYFYMQFYNDENLRYGQGLVIICEYRGNG